MTNEVQVTLSVEETQAIKKIAKLADSIEKMAKDSEKSFNKVDKSVSTFAGTLGGIVTANFLGKIASGFKNLVFGSIDAASNVERLQTQFEILTGSQEKAANLFDKLTKFSATTPFQLNDISEASASLLSFGFAADETAAKIRVIGDVAAGSNSRIQEVAQIFGQVSAAGRLTGERLLQFQERAIPIGAALAKSLNVAESAVRDLVSTGSVTFDEFEKAFRSLTEEGGKFQNATEKQSTKINGVISTLKDNYNLLEAAIGGLFAPAILAGAKTLTNAFIALRRGIAGPDTSEQLQEVSNRILLINKALRDSDTIQKQSLLTGRSVDDLTKSYERQLEVLRNRAAELAKGQDVAGPELQLKKEKEVNQQILEARAKLNDEIAILREEGRIAESNSILADNLLRSEQREAEIENIFNFQIRKAEAEAQASERGLQLIIDQEQRRLAQLKISTEKETKIKQAQVERDKAINASRLKDEQSFFNSAASLSQSGNAKLAAIGKAAGLVQIAQATPPAVASSFNYGARIGGPPLGFAFGGIALAAQLEQARRLTAGSFQDGGFVGGTSYSGDKLSANVNSGEAILNSRQQRNFMELANNGVAGNNASIDLLDEIRSLKNVIMMQPVVIDINGREIARAVRDERQAGFAV